MQASFDRKTSVLPPAMEAVRKAVQKKASYALFLTAALLCILSLPLTSILLKDKISVIWCGITLILFTALFYFTTMKLVPTYVERVARELGFTCVHCHKSLFQLQVQRKIIEPVQMTGLCPSCKNPVVQNLDAALVDQLQTQHEKAQRRMRPLHLIGAVIALAGAGLRVWGIFYSPDALALKSLNAKNYDQTIIEANAALRNNPNDYKVLAYRGTAYLRKKMDAEALSDFNRSIELNPKYYLPLAGKCQIDDHNEAYKNAIDDCSRAISSSPSAIPPYIFRAIAHVAEGHYNIAVADFDSAIHLAPNLAFLYAVRGAIFVEDGQFEKARNDFKRAGGIDPNAIGLASGRGILDVVSGDYIDAVRALGKAAEQIPSDASTIIWLHIARYHAGMDDTEALARERSKITSDRWPSAALDLYAGISTIDAVRAQAVTNDTEAAALQSCAADYYIGEYYLERNDRENAKEKFLSAINSCSHTNSAEKQAAFAEIKAQGF